MSDNCEISSKKYFWTDNETKQFLELLREGLVNGEKVKEKVYRDIIANHSEEFKGRTTESLRKKLALEKLAHQKQKSYTKGTGGGPMYDNPLAILQSEVFALLGHDEVLPDAVHKVAPHLVQNFITTESGESDSDSKENFLASPNESISKLERHEKYKSLLAIDNLHREDVSLKIKQIEEKLESMKNNFREDMMSVFKEVLEKQKNVN